MTHGELILDFLRQNGGEATLGQILSAGYGSWGHKFTARVSELRQKGFNIVCQKGPNPSANRYKLIEPEKPRYDQPQYANGFLFEI